MSPIHNARPMSSETIMKPKDALKNLEKSVKILIDSLGEDPQREGLKETPKRVAKMYMEMFSGLYEDPRKHLLKQFTTDQHESPIIVKDIPFKSMCEHHFLPVIGRAHIAYLPYNGKITGLSKLGRLVDGYARRPNLQERLTNQITNAMEEILTPRAVLVIIEAEHMCMTLRGIQSHGCTTTTMKASGLWENDKDARQEIIHLISLKN